MNPLSVLIIVLSVLLLCGFLDHHLAQQRKHEIEALKQKVSSGAYCMGCNGVRKPK